MKPLSILFAGEVAPVALVDGTRGRVFVRAQRQQHFGHVLATAEHKHLLVELVSYFKAEPKKKAADHPLDAAVRVSGPAAFPDVEIPEGYQPVPLGWASNLDDESLDRLYELGSKLNFTRAATAARGQIAAKQFMAPLQELAMSQVLPLVEQVIAPMVARIERLFSSTPNAPSSSVSPASSSSPKTSSG